MRIWRSLVLLGILAVLAPPTLGLERHLAFSAVVQSARLIFAGTVTQETPRYGPKGKMIFTDVYFTDIDLIYLDPSFPLAGSDPILLSFAGGELDGRAVSVSDSPDFTEGDRYLLCVEFDDPVVANPVAGGLQGIFRLICDRRSGKWYPLTLGESGIEGVDDSGELRLTRRVEAIDSGVVKYAADPLEHLRYAVAARPSSDSPSPHARASVSEVMERKQSPPGGLIDLSGLKAQIQARLEEKGRAAR